MDNGFCALDELRRKTLRDAFGYEFLVIDVSTGADEFAEGFAEADEVPPDDGGLVLVRVAKGVIIVIGGVQGVKVVEEGEGAEVEREAEEGGIIGIEDTVGEGVGLPSGDGAGVAADNFAVKAGETVFFGTGGTLDLRLRNRMAWFEGGDIERFGLIEDGWKR